MHTRLATEETSEWSSFLLPALLGQPAIAIHNIETHFNGNPSAFCPPTLRIAARAMGAIGGEDVACELLHMLNEKDDLDSEILLALSQPDSACWAWVLSTNPAFLGRDADRCCDVATLALARHDPQACQMVVTAGLLTHPDHGELGRWRRFLAETNINLACRLVNARLRGEPLPSHPPGVPHWDRTREDVLHLIPHASSGWLPTERISRKLLSGAWDHPGPRGSALEHLQTCGCTYRYFLSDEEYAQLPAGHESAELELLMDRLQSLCEEQRPANATFKYIWSRLKGMPAALLESGAYVLATLGISHPPVARVARVVLNWMLRQHLPPSSHHLPSLEQMRWKALLARLLVTLEEGAEARRLAKAVLAQTSLPEPVLRLAREALNLGTTAVNPLPVQRRANANAA